MKYATYVPELLVMPLVALQQPVEGIVHLGAVAQEAQQVGAVAILVEVLATAQDVVVAGISHFVKFLSTNIVLLFLNFLFVFVNKLFRKCLEIT